MMATDVHTSCRPSATPAHWKLIVAADAPWSGEIYHTRPGNHRHRFDSVESFCGALLSVTGWPLHALSSESSAAPASSAAGRSHRAKLLRDNTSGRHKFIVAADQPWTGRMYRTRPGLGQHQFTTFEGFLRSVVSLTGWSIDSRSPREHDHGYRSGVPISRLA